MPRDILRRNQIDSEHEFRVRDIWQLNDADASDFKFTGNCRRHRGERAIASRLDEDLIVGNKHRRVRSPSGASARNLKARSDLPEPEAPRMSAA